MKSLMLTLASLPAMATQAPAQNVRVDFSGFVRDTTGAVVPGAEVVIVNETTNARRVVQTDDQGRYAAAGFFVDSYRIEVSKPGFQKAIDHNFAGGDVMNALYSQTAGAHSVRLRTAAPLRVARAPADHAVPTSTRQLRSVDR